jgi:hypothetical protein
MCSWRFYTEVFVTTVRSHNLICFLELENLLYLVAPSRELIVAVYRANFTAVLSFLSQFFYGLYAAFEYLATRNCRFNWLKTS